MNLEENIFYCLSCNMKCYASGNRKKYCSEKCQEKYNNVKILNRRFDICPICGKFKYLNKIGYPCRTCINNGGTDKVMQKCLVCSKDFEVDINARNRNVYCSRECRVNGKCIMCGIKAKLSNGKCYYCIHGVARKSVSVGEQLLRLRISELYRNEKIHNYRPDWLKEVGAKRSMEIDVAIPELRIGFEFDGRPHLDENHPGYANSERNDIRKMKIAASNSWTIIKIRSIKIVKSAEYFRFMLDQIDNEYDFDIKNDYTKNLWISSHLFKYNN